MNCDTNVPLYIDHESFHYKLNTPVQCLIVCFQSCEPRNRLCPSDGICIPETSWCNGLEECTDDELDCEVQEQVVTQQALEEESTTIGNIT